MNTLIFRRIRSVLFIFLASFTLQPSPAEANTTQQELIAPNSSVSEAKPEQRQSLELLDLPTEILQQVLKEAVGFDFTRRVGYHKPKTNFTRCSQTCKLFCAILNQVRQKAVSKLWIDSDALSKHLAHLDPVISLHKSEKITNQMDAFWERYDSVKSLDIDITEDNSLGRLAYPTSLETLKISTDSYKIRSLQDLSHLTSLTDLELLGKGDIEEQVMRECARLPKLKRIKVTNLIPGQILPNVLKLTQLSDLNISSNEITIDFLRQLTTLSNLGAFTLGGCPYYSKADPQEQPHSKAPAQPTLINPNLNYELLSPIGNLRTLSSLGLHNYQLCGESLEAFAQLTQLETLVIQNCVFQGRHTLSFLSKFKQLHTLDLSDSSLSGNTYLPYLDGLTRLSKLYLMNGSGISSRHLVLLNHLKVLSLSQCTLDDQALSGLKNMSQLEDLDLSSNHITGAGLQHLTQLTQLRILSLKDCATLSELKHLSAFANLVKLTLSRTNISDSELKHCNNLTQLEALKLVSCHFLRDKSLADLNPLSQLRRLDLSNTPITGKGLSLCTQLLELETLKLRGTHLCDQAFTYIAQFTKLSNLHIQDSYFCSSDIHFRCNATFTGKYFSDLYRLTKLKSIWIDPTSYHRLCLQAKEILDTLPGVRIKGLE